MTHRKRYRISGNCFIERLSCAWLFLLLLTLIGWSQTQSTIEFVRVFDTDNSTIRSTTPAGIGYHSPSGHLYISDSEINASGDWDCENIFEVPTLGDVLIQSYDAYAEGGKPCPDKSHREPTGITHLDGFFYITDDDEGSVMKQDGDFGLTLLQKKAEHKDVEGITSDPASGLIYALVAKISGKGSPSKVLVFDGDLNFYSNLSFELPDVDTDPEGIAYHTPSNHLFLVSTPTLLVYEVDLDGNVLSTYDISGNNGFSPTPNTPQGLTFAPSSDPNDSPAIQHLYIADGAGRIYEANIPTTYQPEPDIAVNPASHDYGDVFVGFSDTQIFDIRNDGSEDLVVSDMTLVGGEAAEFGIEAATVAFTLTPGSSQEITVRFSPASAGPKSTTLRIASNDPDENPLDVPLSGNGLTPAPDITVLPASHDYGQIIVNDDAFQTFEIRNDGVLNEVLEVSQVQLTGGEAGEFHFVSNPAPFSLAPGESEMVEVRFTPTTTGSKTTTLRILSNDPDEDPLDVALSGEGVPVPVPDIAVTPDVFDYSPVVQGGSRSQSFTVLNEGTADLEVSGSSLTGSDAASFSIDNGGGAVSLAPGEEHTIAVSFNPTAVGDFQATLQISSNDPDEDPLDVPLSGSGVETPSSDGYITFQESQSGGSSDATTVTTGGSLTGIPADLYLAVIAAKPHREVTDVTGMGMTWTFLRSQCAGRGQTGVSIYMAQGSPTSGTVNATFAEAPSNATIIVTRYSGVDPANPIGAILSGNTNGPDGACNGGSDNSAYSFSINTALPKALIFGAAAMRNKDHLPGEGFSERAEAHQGSGGSEASVAVMDSSVDFPATLSVNGTFSGDVDWAVIALEIIPGDAPDLPEITLSPASHSYGSVVINTSAAHSFTVKNDGRADLEVSEVSLAGTDPGQFGLDDDGGAPFTLAPGESRELTVSFAPTSPGEKSAILRIASNDPDEDPLDAPLSGTAIDTPEPDIAVEPAGYDYGAVVQGNSRSQNFTVRNEGTANLEVSGSGLSGSDPASFSIDSGGGAVSLAPGEEHTIAVSFNPTASGDFQATLQINSNDPDENPLDVALSGSATAALPDIAVDPASHDYGALLVNGTASQSFTVRNEGTADLEVSGSSLTGSDAASFSIDSGGGAVSLAPGEEHTIAVSFNPTAVGDFQAALQISSNDPDEDPLDVPLSGSGVETPSSDGYITFQESQSGGSSDATTVTTEGSLTGIPADLYLAVIAAKPHREVTDVTGMGMTWTFLRSQCAGRGQTGVSIYMAQGSPTSGTVNATFAEAPSNATIIVTRYSGVDPANPIGAILSGNTNGLDGACNGGSDNSAYSFSINTALPKALVLGAAAMRNKDHLPGEGFSERAEAHQGSGGSEASVAVMDSSVDFASTLSVNGTFSGDVDWAVIALEIIPGDAPDLPEITLSPASHSYGSVVINTSAAHSFTVKNDGRADLEVSEVSLAGTDPGQFGLDDDGGAPFTLAPGESRELTVSFAPTSLGEKSAILRIASNDPDEDPLDAPLSGTAIDTPEPDIAVEPAGYDYGAVVQGNSRSQNFTVRNEGSANLEVSGSSLTGSDPASFSIDSGGGAVSLAPGEEHTIAVSFNPTASGDFQATLRISSNDPDENPLDVALSGSGVETPPVTGTVAFEEHQSGGSSDATTVTTEGSLSGLPGDLFLAVVSSKPHREVTAVSGLGLTWMPLHSQCAARSQTGVSVWMAQGSPASGPVTASLAEAPSNAVIVVGRYSGSDPTDPIGAIVSGNTNGENGVCSGGSDGDVYSFPLTTGVNNALLVGAAAMRSKEHFPGAGFSERAEVHQGSGGSGASVALVDSAIEFAATVHLNGTFSGGVDWAVIGIEIKPQAGTMAKLNGSGETNPALTAALPREFRLEQNYPNPFNPATTIQYALPQPALVTVTIYDVQGKEVRRLLHQAGQDAGNYALRWDSRSEAGRRVASGVYFYTLQVRPLSGVGELFNQTQRMILLK